MITDEIVRKVYTAHKNYRRDYARNSEEYDAAVNAPEWKDLNRHQQEIWIRTVQEAEQVIAHNNMLINLCLK